MIFVDFWITGTSRTWCFTPKLKIKLSKIWDLIKLQYKSKCFYKISAFCLNKIGKLDNALFYQWIISYSLSLLFPDPTILFIDKSRHFPTSLVFVIQNAIILLRQGNWFAEFFLSQISKSKIFSNGVKYHILEVLLINTNKNQ